jgi:hypothetical protein
VISHWSEGQTLMQVHEMGFPKYNIVRNEHCNNVPLGAYSDKVPRTKRRNICTLYLFQAPTQNTVESHERSNRENETEEMILVEKVGK